MTTLFITFLNMTISASVVALAVMLVRIPLKKAPKIFSYVLWSVVLFRLICPLSFNSGFSFMPISANTVPQNILFAQKPAIQSGIAIVDNSVNTAINNTLQPVNPAISINPIQPVLEICGFIWLLGFATLLLYAVIGYVRLKRRVYYATLIRDNIYETDKIKTPFVLGFIRPKIYIPTSIEAAQFDYILKHEQIHIVRRDYLIKPFTFIILALHWFNPFIWLSYFLMSKDMEMSCDEAVLRKTDEDIRSSYSSSLLNLSTKRTGLINPLAFGESNVKSRVKNVLNYKKTATWITIVSVIVVATFLVGFIPNQANIGNVIGADEPKLGTYVSESEFSPMVILQENNEFVIVNPRTSYTPTGKYTVEENRVFLTVIEGEEYLFIFENDNLIFESGAWLENWIEQGTVFQFTSNDLGE